jgi:hypothetical protein
MSPKDDFMTITYSDVNVHIVGNDDLVGRMFTKRGIKIVKDKGNNYDIQVFTGGPDVVPFLYGEKPIKGVQTDWERDLREIAAFKTVRYSKPRIGICRGAQLLNVLSGGRMWQDVTGHRGSHDCVDNASGEVFQVTSTHHQMMRPGTNGRILAAACTSTNKKMDGQEFNITQNVNDVTLWRDPEVIWYPGSSSLCFQPHPEYHHAKTEEYFFGLFNEYMLPLIAKNKEAQ